MPCLPGVKELSIGGGLANLWAAAPLPHLRSVSQLQLHTDLLDVPRLAAMTALRSLHMWTSEMPATIAEAVPTLKRLTRLEFWAHAGADTGQPNAQEFNDLSRATRRAQLSRLLQALSALPLLRHLQLGGAAFDEVQALGGDTAFPVLEVLQLHMPVLANDKLFISGPARQPR